MSKLGTRNAVDDLDGTSTTDAHGYCDAPTSSAPVMCAGFVAGSLPLSKGCGCTAVTGANALERLLRHDDEDTCRLRDLLGRSSSIVQSRFQRMHTRTPLEDDGTYTWCRYA